MATYTYEVVTIKNDAKGNFPLHVVYIKFEGRTYLCKTSKEAHDLIVSKKEEYARSHMTLDYDYDLKCPYIEDMKRKGCLVC